ncbi:ABC transporter permease [Lachnoclostridium phytofermentans]|uniref:Inner-membrane translocator n=1 Tax=Lachnoclostridium phytofermentans (strain ATCC 700394 / DSM 18823 / ISDg) TaxID=357809 RepID=A9KIF2_LACP7|nr:ABC transporter permease [Lachnoclostridium phytofermentans]ABX42404.1 inner-membrane translocator [Lachnoclostridium phytofermentans ISDg]
MRNKLKNSKVQAIMVPIIAIIVSLLVGAVVLLGLGKNPISVYYNILQGAGILPKPSYAGYKGLITDFFSLLNMWTPMLFASLAVAVALKAGLFNIGVAGQMLTAGFVSTIVVGYSSLNDFLAKPLVILISILTGALVGGLIGWLKHRYNINEVVSSIMINYIAQYVISFFITMYYINPVSRQSNPVSKAARLTLVDMKIGNYKMDIPLSIILAIILVFVVRFLLNRTKVGFELKAIGESKNTAKYAGMNVGKNMVLAMAISGALAGLAGVTYYLGYFGSIQPKVLPSIGFDSIAVALLGNSNPVGILFSSLLISIINKGSTYMSSAAGVEAEIASVITGIILLFSACSFYIRHKIDRISSKSEEKKSETLTELQDIRSSFHKEGKQEEKKIESTEVKEDNKWN